LALLAAVYRLAFAAAMPRVLDTADAIRYLTAAQDIAAGNAGALDPRIPIGYPALSGALIAVGVEAEFATRIVSVVAGVALIIPLYLLASRMFGRAPAIYAGVIVALWPWIADWSLRTAPESLAMLLWFTALLALYDGMEGRKAAIGIAALALFGLHLTRPEGLVIMIAAPFLVAVTLPTRAGIKRATLLGIAIVVLLAAQYGLTAAIAGEGSVTARMSPEGSLRYVFVERSADLVRTFGIVLSHNIPVMLGPVLLGLAGFGLLAKGERNGRLEVLVLLFAAVQAVLAVLSTWPEPRYIMAVVLAVSMWSARGIDLSAMQLRAAGRGRLAQAPLAVVVALMLFGTVTTVAAEWLGSVPREPREYRIAGEWMRENVEPGLIITRKPQVGVYAGMETQGPLPEHSVGRMIEWMRAIDAAYLVVDERYTAQMNPNLRPLLDPENAPEELELVRADLSPYEKARILVYRLRER